MFHYILTDFLATLRELTLDVVHADVQIPEVRRPLLGEIVETSFEQKRHIVDTETSCGDFWKLRSEP